MATVSSPEVLLTAEEFGDRPDPGYPEELVRGRIIKMPPPKPRHGEICLTVGRILGNYVADHALGRVLGNDSGVITERGPDTLRGADIAFYSYARVPKGPLPDHYLDVPPELVIEVRSPTDRWPKILAKAAEYLEAGVLMVVVLDDNRKTAHVFEADAPVRILNGDDEFSFSEVLGDFRVGVGHFFE
jgi:Uma2 family endonuclease